MAFAHLHFNQGTQYGSKLRNMLTLAEQGDDTMAEVLDMMVQMIDGDGSSSAHFEEHVRRFGFGDYDVSTQSEPTADQLTTAKAAYDELASAYAKISGNGSVSNVRAARDQLFNKMRG